MTIKDIFNKLVEFEEKNGVAPTKIFCGIEAFRKLRHEAVDNIECRYLEYDENGYRFMGIPIEIIRDLNHKEHDDRIYVVNEKRYDDYFTLHNHGIRHRYDPIERYHHYKLDFDTATQYIDTGYNPGGGGGTGWSYTPKWVMCGGGGAGSTWWAQAPKEDELPDISDDDLMSVLNGGGFNAVA